MEKWQRSGMVKLRKQKNDLDEFQRKMKEMQGEKRLLKEEVDSEDIAEVVAKWTGIPVSKMLQSEREKLLHLEEELDKRVAGQEEAIRALSDAVRRSQRRSARSKTPDRFFHFYGYDRRW